MSSPYQSYDSYDAPRDMFVADAQLSERLGFLRRVYGHVFGAIVLMIGIETLLFTTGMNVKVPLFMKVGDRIKIDTRTGDFVERVN